MATYSALNISIDDQINFTRSQNPVYSANISGVVTQSLTFSNTYALTLTGNATFSISNAAMGSYNFLITAGTYTFTLGTGSFKTQGATAVGLTGSFVLSGVYDGSRMWLATPASNFINL